jgi:hypothetical protein
MPCAYSCLTRHATQSSCFHWWEPLEGYAPVPADCKVHGESWLDEDYYLAIVPPTASLELAFDDGKENTLVSERELVHREALLASSQNLLKLLIGLIQAIWATTTVYRAGGDQIQQYGYAAFGLTVAPYAFMSIFNTLANMLTPDYPSMFLIRTPELEEAEKLKKGFFKGVICVKLKDANTAEDIPRSWIGHILASLDNFFFSLGSTSMGSPLAPSDVILVLGLSFSLIPLAIVGGISGFQQGNSSQIERGFTMSWLVIGIAIGVMVGPDDPTERVAVLLNAMRFASLYKTIIVFIAIAITYGVPATGGMVMVAKMIHDFGVCTLIN